ncbi:P-loop containing nucleoside triphosphate hydrolase protein [Myxozyma melibiosi]|uniref:P-loop containing nucleoside triphosphate hydrolase protein n=1 Tax=Myxozyma melibiosi TaxID=54550 RepID=A0ABR1F9Z3_9ASCO
MAKYDDEKAPLTVTSKAVSEDSKSVSSASTRKGYSSIQGLDDEFSGLPEKDAEVLRQQISVPEVSASFFRLFRYANRRDLIILFGGVAASILEGLMRPLMSYVFGFATEQFTNLPTGMTNMWGNSTYDRYSLALFLIATAVSLLTYIKSFIFIDRAEVLASRVREEYLAATLRQNIGYFDKLGAGEITTRIASDTVLVQDAMSEKVAYVISHTTTFISSIILSFTQSAELTAIILGNVVAIIVVSLIGSKVVTKFAERSQSGYGGGATLAEEAISSVRNVKAFGIQDCMVQAFDKFLQVSEAWDLRAGYASGIQSGLVHMFAFGIDALTYWQGTRLLTEDKVSVGIMMTCVMALFQGAFAFTIISPYLANISAGLAASTKIFATIDRKSAIDSSVETGEKLATINGDIELNDVRFIYPSRPNVTVLRNFSLKIPAGKTVALVGSSGSGKSTIIGLIERFYNPLEGLITLDGHDITELNIRWLRQNIALVSQEPNLFAVSIFENISYGLIGTKYEHASREEKMDLIIDACKQANAWDFICDLPDGLDTEVGERGFLMSGGQKQRIAIARAIVSNPKILLLDEATSALDTKSEGVVQEALDRASKNRTTIVIAHRLSTIKDADLIVVMRTGVILEQGTHNELIEKKGEYFGLVEAQSIAGVAESFVATPDADDGEAQLDEKAGIEMSSLAKVNTTATEGIFDSATGETEELASAFTIMKMLFRIGRKDLAAMLLGLYSGALTGIAYIGLSVLYAFALTYLQEYGTPYYYDMLRRAVYPLAAFIFMHGAVLFFSNSVAGITFGYASSRLVRRLRGMSFRQLLRQDVSFFDMSEHSVGVLTSSLASDAQSIDALGGETTNKMVESMVVMIGGLIFSLFVGYKLGLVMFATVPLILVIGYFRFRFLANYMEQTKEENTSSSDYACEATSAIRTVLSLTREEEIMERYRASLARTVKSNRGASNKSAIFDGFSRGMQYYIMALGFYYGGQLVASGEYSLYQFFLIFLTVVFGSESITTVFTFAPEMGKALRAGRNIKALLEAEPTIDSESTEGTKIDSEKVNGEIEFHDVHFRYPTRMNVPVLRGLNLKVKKGQFIALVGSSGCGKSTTIGLIESFYRPQRGMVTLDGVDISTLNVASYRSQIALVQQEPVLYAGSIRYNVALGSPTPVTDEQIEQACRSANIHDLIMSLPDGYDTLCGSKGALLSGGQKQRIAIARALIREPKVLLLDEATSALDSESEKVVQAALDVAAKGRTTIAVAHRLSTIQNADIIYVFENGRILESGSHQQLLANKGKYFDLVQLQALEKN